MHFFTMASFNLNTDSYCLVLVLFRKHAFVPKREKPPSSLPPTIQNDDASKLHSFCKV